LDGTTRPEEPDVPVCPDTDLTYDRAGPADGPTVVLLHAGVADRRMWEPQWPGLTATCDVVRLDLRGFGESATRPGGGWFAHHDDVTRTLASLGVRQAHLVGCSLGAGVAVEVALAAPHLVRSLVLLAPGGSLLTEDTTDLRRFVEAEDAALEGGDLDAAVAANVTTWVDGPHRDADEARAEVRARVATMQRRAFEITAEWDDVDEVELEPAAVDRLGEVGVPTLVLTGSVDLDAVRAAAEVVTARVPEAWHEEWPDTAHLPSLERPDDVTALVTRWVGSAAPV
jgi:3-oxoadipate enol-lactonase